MTTSPLLPEPAAPALPIPPEPFGEVPPARDLAAPSSGRRWLLPVAAGVAGVALGVAGTLAAPALLTRGQDSSALPDALSTCGVTAATPTNGFVLGDDDRTLTFDNKGEEDLVGASTDDVLCVLGALHVPSSVLSHVEQTTSVDGRQQETWDGITLSWTYHPDRGLDGVVTVGNRH